LHEVAQTAVFEGAGRLEIFELEEDSACSELDSKEPCETMLVYSPSCRFGEDAGLCEWSLDPGVLSGCHGWSTLERLHREKERYVRLTRR